MNAQLYETTYFFKDANDFPGAGSLCDVLDWYEKAGHKASDSWKL